MYTIIMYDGKVVEYFMGGFDTFEEAEEINYSLYIYKDGGLKLYDGVRPRRRFINIREAIEYVQRRIAKLKSISKPEFHEFYRKQQILVVEYTDSWTSRIRGVLTNEGKCYTEIPLSINPEVLQTEMV